MNRNPDSPVPTEQRLACALWKCHRNAVYGIGDGSVTWWTIQPIERQWWQQTADLFRDALTVTPDLIAPAVATERERGDMEPCAEFGQHPRGGHAQAVRGRTPDCLPFCQGGLHEEGCAALDAAPTYAQNAPGSQSVNDDNEGAST